MLRNSCHRARRAGSCGAQPSLNSLNISKYFSPFCREKGSFLFNPRQPGEGAAAEPPWLLLLSILVENLCPQQLLSPWEGRAQTSTGLGEARSVFEQLKAFNENQGKEF